jgi:ribosome assembly protein RRB1
MSTDKTSISASAAMGIDQGEKEEDERLPYLPGLGQGGKLAEDEELVADLSSKSSEGLDSPRARLIIQTLSAYVLLHHARLQWPCLSFDVLRDVRTFHFCRVRDKVY